MIHISEAGKQAIDYIVGRKNGSIKSLKTPWDKLNSVLLDGFEFNQVILIAGMSSSGKTLIGTQLETSVFDLNPNQPLAILNLSFEMISKNLIIRRLSAKKDLSIRDLLSVEQAGYKITDKDIQEMRVYLNSIKDLPIYYQETSLNVTGIRNIVKEFYTKYKLPFIIIHDHTLLTKQATDEKNIQDTCRNLSNLVNDIKKEYPCIYIMIGQLNRSIEEEYRISKPSYLNFPQRSDIYESSTFFNMADTVIINHRPFLLNLTHYGKPDNKVEKDDIYFHCIKQRTGDLAVLKMKGDFSHMKILDA